MHGRALLQSPPQQSGYSSKRVAYPVDVFPTASQYRRVTIGQSSDLQQQRVVKAVLHAAQKGHQVDQRAVSMSLKKTEKRAVKMISGVAKLKEETRKVRKKHKKCPFYCTQTIQFNVYF